MLRHVCANLENIFKIRWDQEEVVFSFFHVIHVSQKIAKEGMLLKLEANLENILQTRRVQGKTFSCKTDTSPE